MNPSSARVQAGIAIGLAALVGGAWLLFGAPIRIRWLVARGSHPAPREEAERAADDLRAMGARARPVLEGILADGSSPWRRKAWVASVLLRAPFFDHAPVDAALASPHPPTARAAAFALMEGEEFLERGGAGNFEESLARVESARAAPGKATAPPPGAFDPSPAIPVLARWAADASDPDAVLAVLILGRIPPGDLRVRDALLAVVEDVPRIFAPGAGAEAGRRKILVVDALQGLLAWARDDAETASRVAKVIAWIEENGHSDTGWDIQRYGLRLFQASRGRGADPALLKSLAGSSNAIVRQTLAHTLETARGGEAGPLLAHLASDEAFPVRRAAIFSLRKRKDPLLLELLPFLVEDASIYCRSDALKSVGELRGVAPEGCRAAVPLLVSCLEDPWPGPDPPPGSRAASSFAADRADVVQGAALSLYMITFQCPGFVLPGPPGGKPELAILDNRRRSEIAAALAADPAKRREVVAEWRKTVPERPASDRVPHLVRRLEDRDPECVLRACRELKRITGDAAGIPEALLAAAGDDTDARNLIREMRKKGEWGRVVESWKARK